MEEVILKLLIAHLPSKSGWTNMHSINIKFNCDPQFRINTGSAKLDRDVINHVNSNCGSQLWTSRGDFWSFLRVTTKSPEFTLQKYLNCKCVIRPAVKLKV